MLPRELPLNLIWSFETTSIEMDGCSQNLLIMATGLDTDDVEHIGECGHRRGGQIDTGLGGIIVEHDRKAGRLGDGPVMPD